MHRAALLSLAAIGVSSCAGLTPLYPPRPVATSGAPVQDPTPSRIVVHATVSGDALRRALDDKLPKTGEGTVAALGTRKYTFRRDPVAVRFDKGRIGVDVHVVATIELPVAKMDLPLDVRVLAEPVVTSAYVVRFQSIEVSVSSTDTRLKLAEAAAGALAKIKSGVEKELEGFSYDLRPLVADLYGKVSQPITLPLGDASGCATLNVLGVEAGPTVLADGIEKDLALVVAPQVTMPCPEAHDPPPLPQLANVAMLQSGPFTVTVPIAARYDELAKAMSLAFTDGKLFFSEEFPKLYLEKPEVYASQDTLVLRLHIAGPVHKFGGDHDIDGDIYFAGHPKVEDNEIRVSDLEPTIETKSLLLKLKAMLDGDKIRDEARAALRLDLSERLKSVKDKLSTGLEFGDGQGCLKADAGKIEVTGLFVHGAYLRLYVAATARAAVYMPCPQ